MSYYRLYFMNGGHIGNVEEISARDDVEAVRQAKARSCSEQSELWCGSRKIHTFGARAILRASDLYRTRAG